MVQNYAGGGMPRRNLRQSLGGGPLPGGGVPTSMPGGGVMAENGAVIRSSLLDDFR